LQKWKFNFCYPKGFGLSQNTKTERFGGQPERSVFPVWVLTGFACYDISRAKNAILAPTKRTGARSLKFDCVLRFFAVRIGICKNISKSFLSVFKVKGCSWLLRGLSFFK